MYTKENTMHQNGYFKIIIEYIHLYGYSQLIIMTKLTLIKVKKPQKLVYKIHIYKIDTNIYINSLIKKKKRILILTLCG